MEFYDNREYKYESINLKEVPTEKSQIETYYNGKTVLVTGATGFLGTLLIEKLLRQCTDIKSLILIVRRKAAKTAHDRVNEMFTEEIFYKVKTATVDSGVKLKVLDGNCELPDLGLDKSLETRKLLQSVDIVFHLAGNVRLDDSLKKAYTANILPAKNALKMIPQLSSLKAFVFVSTIYSDSAAEFSWYDEGKLEKCLEVDEKVMASFLPKFLKEMPNTFVYAKSIAEILAASYISRFPVIICRLPFVMPTMEEPLTCWTSHLTGTSDILTGIGSGFLRTVFCDKNGLTAMAPADRVINGLICLPFHFQKTVNKTAGSYQPIYNFIASPNDSLTWLTVMRKLEHAQTGSNSRCWAGSVLTKCPVHWLGKYYLFHLLPILLLSLVRGFNQQVSGVWKEYSDWIIKNKRYEFFTVNSSCSADKSYENTRDLIADINFEDKIIFNCDTNLDWEVYFFRLEKFFNNYLEQFHLDAYKFKRQDKLLNIFETAIRWTVRVVILWVAYQILVKIYQIIIVDM